MMDTQPSPFDDAFFKRHGCSSKNTHCIRLAEGIFAELNEQAKAEIIAQISHQWRQPLNLIMLKTQNLLFDLDNDEPPEAAALRKELTFLNEQVQALDGVIRTFSNEHSESPFQYDCIEDIITDSIEKTQKDYPRARFTFEQPERNHLPLPIREFQAMLSALFLNSLEAAEKNRIGDPEIQISTAQTSKTSDEWITLRITDRCGGVEESMQHDLFTPYSTTKFSAAHVGLGLFRAKLLIVKRLKGAIEPLFDPEGLTLEIRLPRRRRA